GGHCEDTDLKDEMYVALVYHMFPPATTLDRGQYKNLLANRADRQKDIPEAVLALNQDASKSTFSISVGRYELKEGEEIDTTPWTVITTSIREENEREIDELLEDELVKTGKWFLEVLADPKRLALEQNRLLQQIYRHHRSLNGITLKGDLESRDGLMELKEYVADRMKDTVDRLLQTYAAKHPADYELLVKMATEKSIDEKAKNGMIKNMLRVLGSTSLDATQTNERLTAILNGAGIRVEGDIFDEALQRIQHIEDDAAVTEALKTFLRSLLEGAANARQSGKLSVDIVNRLLGKDYARMQEEVQKYTFIEGAEGGVTKKFRLEISKKRAHGAAGLNMGVCVAPDAKLWEKPTFANVVLWDENNIARGGMHIELVMDSWRTYVVLPGINPSMAILSSSDPVKLYDHLINFAKRIAESVNASAILIPTNPTIHSNRAEIQTIITSKKYPKFSSASSHAFSYSPHAYSWNEAYQVDV
ncbi:MAG: hypothetical protein Q8R07_04885, partial [Candidatus Uhrbacteria bacterium]|nr:hypothetical protein [Candidatus Uhrbacteria bacterium]